MKKLAIIGASYLQLPLVNKAKEMGIETHCFAWEDGAVCKGIADFFYPISIIEKEAIYQKCAEINIDGITTIATDMAVPAICYTGERLNLVTNSFESALDSTNKELMRRRFSQVDIRSPRFEVVNSVDKAQLRNLDFPLIVKPVDRSGSRGVSKVNDEKELDKAIGVAIDASFVKKCLVEEFIEGSEVSVEGISWNGEHYILAVTDKITTGSPYFVELAHHQPSQLPATMLDMIRAETCKSLDALGIRFGASHSEFKINANGELYVIEVGARMGGDFIGSHLVQLSTGYDFVKGVIEVAINEFQAPVVEHLKGKSCGVYFLCKETSKLQPYFQHPNEFDFEKSILREELINITNSNDRSGYLIYKSEKRVELL